MDEAILAVIILGGVALTLVLAGCLIYRITVRASGRPLKVPKHQHNWGMWEKYERNFARMNLVTGELHYAGCELWQKRRCTTCGEWEEKKI